MAAFSVEMPEVNEAAPQLGPLPVAVSGKLSLEQFRSTNGGNQEAVSAEEAVGPGPEAYGGAGSGTPTGPSLAQTGSRVYRSHHLTIACVRASTVKLERAV